MSSLRFLLTTASLAVVPAAAAGQAGIDPSVAPRAVSLDRAGHRAEATELLGHYLATAPDDAAAWLELGRIYLLDSRAWHLDGHQGDPPGSLYLDFAATALDQSLRRATDSSLLVRAEVEMDRSVAAFELAGAPALHERWGYAAANAMPRYLVELGQNLVNSCPVGGILVTGSDLERVSAWAAGAVRTRSGDRLVIDPGLYAGDSLYRGQVAALLEISDTLSLARAMLQVSGGRPVCLTPLADSTLAGGAPLASVRLVRVAGDTTRLVPQGLSVVELVTSQYANPNALIRDVLAIYLEAARHNDLLCGSLVDQLGVRGGEVCGN
jgi:hypothetical protein